MEEQELKLSEKAYQDYVLVQAALEGDEKAFARLLGRYKDAIYLCSSKCKQPQRCEDLTLEAFGKAFKNCTSIHQPMLSVPGCLKLHRTIASIFYARKKEYTFPLKTPTTKTKTENNSN
jgi:RNA polymerase sigma-70 factor (ECF subfamily)